MPSKNANAIVDQLWNLSQEDVLFLLRMVSMKAVINKMEDDYGCQPAREWDTEKLFSDMENTLLSCYNDALIKTVNHD